jgi:hypothetical protein
MANSIKLCFVKMSPPLTAMSAKALFYGAEDVFLTIGLRDFFHAAELIPFHKITW